MISLGSYESSKTDQDSEIEKLNKAKIELTSQLEEFEKGARNQSQSRNSITSDEDYSSVTEMKDHLKHAREILIQFICKLNYS